MRRRGMTLLEVLLAVALFGALMGGLYKFYFGLLQVRSDLARNVARQEAASLLMDRMEAALGTAITQSRSGLPGLIGNENELTVSCRSVDLPGASMRDEQRWACRFDGTLVMEQEESTAVLSTDVADMQLRFFDDQWLNAFDSLTKGHLPAAVEVSLWFDAPRDEGRVPDRRRIIRLADTEPEQ
ncbi:MAG: prepilin-type N-terminal cleavage/methylation domain-containing protein [Phycisphaerales bacterium]|jgi:prepilin-type N-terminal cleavage/methylation domain-containing protein|nr:prepilin-type N-terminal cleavage/methylation domain-containing protein [Phycisphaerales bacterium]